MRQCFFLILVTLLPNLSFATDFNALIEQGIAKEQKLSEQVASTTGRSPTSDSKVAKKLKKKGVVKAPAFAVKLKHSPSRKIASKSRPKALPKKAVVAKHSKSAKSKVAKAPLKKHIKLASTKAGKKSSPAHKHSKHKIASN